MFKEKTTWVAIIAALIVIVLTIAVFMGKLSGTEYAAALGGVGTLATVMIGVLVNDRIKKQ
jgi:uncharacterized membrane protein